MSATQTQLGVLSELSNAVEKLIERHKAERKLWFPSEILDVEEREHLAEQAQALPTALRAGLALNLLTEEGLPHFHRLIAQYTGHDSAWGYWNNLWTAEEDRHGVVLHDYVRDAKVLDLLALEKMQYHYLEAGFNPDWQQDAYRLIAYTSLQEKATQLSHANLARLAAPYEPKLQHILSRVAADESRHHCFYRDTFALLLEADPERALQAAWAVMPKLVMPGHNIPGFRELSDCAHAAGIYGPKDYALIVRDLLSCWGIAAARGLSNRSEQLQDKLLQLPDRIIKLAERLAERRTLSTTTHFDFLPTTR